MQEQISLEDEVADYGYEGSDREDEDEEIKAEIDGIHEAELAASRSGGSDARPEDELVSELESEDETSSLSTRSLEELQKSVFQSVNTTDSHR